ncbi:MAG TPA: 50S ribosomal protein L11 methyltransferase [Planctomycetes bacterium]|nr:50S ribosomal protein L11 methyltransferase [Planctomycetota bacterium]
MSEGWDELSVEVAREEAEALGARLLELGSSGLMEAPGDGRAPRQLWDEGPEPPPPATLLLTAWFRPDQRARVAAGLPTELTLRWRALTDTDWLAASQASFAPIALSERLVVAPPWDAPPGALVIEPGQGFGTGDHPTTRLAWQLVEELLEGAAPPARLLDVGCGSGILALAAARHGVAAAGIDVEAEAVAEAHLNAERNGLVAEFTTTPLAEVPGRFPLVVANLHAELILRLLPDLIARVGERLVLAGILGAERAARVDEACRAAGLVLERELRAEEWRARRWRRA